MPPPIAGPGPSGVPLPNYDPKIDGTPGPNGPDKPRVNAPPPPPPPVAVSLKIVNVPLPEKPTAGMWVALPGGLLDDASKYATFDLNSLIALVQELGINIDKEAKQFHMEASFAELKIKHDSIQTEYDTAIAAAKERFVGAMVGAVLSTASAVVQLGFASKSVDVLRKGNDTFNDASKVGDNLKIKRGELDPEIDSIEVEISDLKIRKQGMLDGVESLTNKKKSLDIESKSKFDIKNQADAELEIKESHRQDADVQCNKKRSELKTLEDDHAKMKADREKWIDDLAEVPGADPVQIKAMRQKQYDDLAPSDALKVKEKAIADKKLELTDAEDAHKQACFEVDDADEACSKADSDLVTACKNAQDVDVKIAQVNTKYDELDVELKVKQQDLADLKSQQQRSLLPLEEQKHELTTKIEADNKMAGALTAVGNGVSGVISGFGKFGEAIENQKAEGLSAEAKRIAELGEEAGMRAAAYKAMAESHGESMKQAIESLRSMYQSTQQTVNESAQRMA